jgi:RNA polymerase sigma-70 factor (ECF subfamily)
MNALSCAAVLNVHSMERSTARDNEIASAAQAGCPKAFAELHALYSRRLYNTILAITKSPEDAEDALQETFLRAHLAIHAFEGRSTVYSWLTRIAINSALMVLRKRRIRSEIVLASQADAPAGTVCFEIKDHAPNPEQIYDLRQRFVRLLRAVRKLSPGLREPIRMRMTNESSLKEIGRTLNITEAAVKARLYRARLRLSVTYQRS